MAGSERRMARASSRVSAAADESFSFVSNTAAMSANCDRSSRDARILRRSVTTLRKSLSLSARATSAS
jgi:hypothetical protein